MSTKSFGMSLWHVSTFAMKNSKFLTLLNKGGTTEKLATKAIDDSRRYAGNSDYIIQLMTLKGE